MFRAVSIAHKLANVEIREKFSLSTEEVDALYIMLKEIHDLNEVLILNTCNRVEVYFFSERTSCNDVAITLCAFKSLSYINHHSFIKTYEGNKAIEFIHRVAIGLESMVLGDLEIFGQVKQAYQRSVDSAMAGPMIHRLMHKVFYCHKQINQETKFKEGAASISYNAAKAVFSIKNQDARIMLVGAGKMAKDIAMHLAKKGFNHLAITNRTEEKAKALAEASGAKQLKYKLHKSLIEEFDVVISTISSGEIEFSADQLNENEILFIDVSSPRTVAHDVIKTGATLIDIDDLGVMVDDVLEQRKEQIPLVENQVKISVSEMANWQEEMMYSKQILQFKETLMGIQKQAMASALKKMTENEKAMAEEVTQKMIQKIVNLPVLQIKNACKRNEAEHLSQSLNALFNIENKNSVKS